MTRGTGFLPVPRDRIEDLWHTHPRAARSGQSYPDADLIPWAPPVDDQDGIGQCTGNAVTTAVMTTLAKAGIPLPGYLDPQSAYRMARCLGRAQGYPWGSGGMPPLVDVGADPNLVYLAGNRHGYGTTMDTFRLPGPCAELTACYAKYANREPQLGELQSSDAFKVIGQHRVLSTGQQRIADVRAALASGFAATMSVYASDDRFQGWRSGVMPPAPSGSPCDHLVCIVCSYTDATGATVFVTQNSWGRGYAEAGRYRAHSGILLQSDTVHVCDVRPR
jgi:hypothetical protein